MKGAIIIGGHVQGLGLVRILGRLGLDIIVMDTDNMNISRHSKYCSKFIKFDRNSFLDCLFEIGKAGKYIEYALIPTNDLYVGILSQNKEELSKLFVVAVDNWESIEKCYNKRITYQVAQSLEIPIAKTWTPDSIEELKQINIEFPCIIKPAVMHTFYSKMKKKVFLCKNEEELIQNYQTALTIIPKNEVIIQTVINSDSNGLYSACFLFDKTKSVQSFVGRRARQHPPDFGNATTFAQIVESDELLKRSIRILKEISYKGVCEVEYMYDNKKDDYMFLEINPRTWKWHSIAEKANINLLENYMLILDDKAPKVSKNEIKKVSFRHLTTDIPTKFQYFLKGIYKKQKKLPVKYAVFDIKDLKPFIFELIYLPFLIIKR
jgi:D-aspartate ligase